MELLTVSVGGFRNVKKTTVHLDSITALVGLNGSGKSNLLKAIDYGFDFLHASSEEREAMMASTANIPLLKTMPANPFSFSIESRLSLRQQAYCIRYEFEFAWQTQRSDAKILTESLQVKRDEKGQKYRSFFSRSEKTAKYLPSETGRCDKALPIDNTTTVLSKLLAYDDLFYAELLKAIRDTEFYIDAHLDASKSFRVHPLVIRDFEELNLNRLDDIPRAIFYLKRDDPSRYALLIDAFQQLFPNIKEIIVTEHKLEMPDMPSLPEEVPLVFSESFYTMRIVDAKLVQPIDFRALSAGTLRIFLLLTMAVIADIKGLSLIAIEEPENSLHPSLLQTLLDILNQLIGSCKIIMSSHSPYMVQYLKPHSIYITRLNDAGEANFERIAAGKVNALFRDATENEESIGDYLFHILSSANADEFLEEYLEAND